MARSTNSHAAAEHDVPAALIVRHREGWNSFTHWVVKACVAVAAALLLMLLFLRVL